MVRRNEMARRSGKTKVNMPVTRANGFARTAAAGLTPSILRRPLSSPLLRPHWGQI